MLSKRWLFVFINYMYRSFMKLVYFLICCAIVAHLNQWVVIELIIEKGVNENASFNKSIYGPTLAKTQIFRLALLQTSVIWFANVNLTLNLIPNSLSYSLFVTSHSLTLKLTFSLEWTNRWHSSGLVFRRLFLNHLNKDLADFSEDFIRFLISPTTTYLVLPSA